MSTQQVYKEFDTIIQYTKNKNNFHLVYTNKGMIMIVDYMYVCFSKSITHKGIKETIELRGFLGQYCLGTKPEDLVEPESLEGELYGTEDVT